MAAPFDEFGLILDSAGSGGNSILFTCQYYILKHARGLGEKELKAFLSAIESCEIQPGLLQRHPGQFRADQEGPDDYYALAAACAVLDLPGPARRVLSWGRSHWGSFNNIEPNRWTAKSWLWRQPGLKGALLWAANERPSFLRRLVMALTIALSSSRPSDGPGWEDAWVLGRFVIQATKNRCWLMRLAIGRFQSNFERCVPGGWGALFSSYYGPSHAITKLWGESL